MTHPLDRPSALREHFTRVFVVVERGVVVSAYANHPDILVDVIDLDSQDPDDMAHARLTVANLDREVEQGTLFACTPGDA